MNEHTHELETEKELRFAVTLTSLILVIEVVGGIISGSLALLSDAAHVFSDAFALMLSWIAVRLASRPASLSRTFGFHRTEIFASLINGVTLFGISFWIFYEAYLRVLAPRPVKSIEMLIVAIIGLLANLWVVLKLKKHKQNLNVRSAFLHALGDALSSVGVILGGIVISTTGLYVVDPVISILIGAVILTGSARLIRESTHILLEGTPLHINLEEVVGAVAGVSGVKRIKDFHVWCICSDICAASAHIIVEDAKLSEIEVISAQIKDTLAKFNIAHTTLQFETG